MPLSMETYCVIEGPGRRPRRCAGYSPPAAPADPDMHERRKTIKTSLTQTVAQGDVVVVPPGTPHWFNAIDGREFTYLESRVRWSGASQLLREP